MLMLVVAFTIFNFNLHLLHSFSSTLSFLPHYGMTCGMAHFSKDMSLESAPTSDATNK